jgi:hypothetical protein
MTSIIERHICLNYFYNIKKTCSDTEAVVSYQAKVIQAEY